MQRITTATVVVLAALCPHLAAQSPHHSVSPRYSVNIPAGWRQLTTVADLEAIGIDGSALTKFDVFFAPRDLENFDILPTIGIVVGPSVGSVDSHATAEIEKAMRTSYANGGVECSGMKVEIREVAGRIAYVVAAAIAKSGIQQTQTQVYWPVGTKTLDLVYTDRRGGSPEGQQAFQTVLASLAGEEPARVSRGPGTIGRLVFLVLVVAGAVSIVRRFFGGTR